MLLVPFVYQSTSGQQNFEKIIKALYNYMFFYYLCTNSNWHKVFYFENRPHLLQILCDGSQFWMGHSEITKCSRCPSPSSS